MPFEHTTDGMHFDKIEGCQGRQRLGWQGEGQYVIVATGKRRLHGGFTAEEGLQSRRHWHLRQVHLQRDTGCLGNMPTVGEQPVGDVQRRRGPATQQGTEGELRHR